MAVPPVKTPIRTLLMYTMVDFGLKGPKRNRKFFVYAVSLPLAIIVRAEARYPIRKSLGPAECGRRVR